MTPEETFKKLSEPLKHVCSNCVNYEKRTTYATCEVYMHEICMPTNITDDPRAGISWEWNRKR